MFNDNLVTLLKMLSAGPEEKKYLAQKLPEKMRAYQDGNIYEINNVREFVLTEDLEGSGLVQLEIYNTVIKGAEPAKCMRNVFPIVTMTTDTMRVPYGNAESVAPMKAEGAEFAAMYQDYNYRTLEAEVYGNFVPISDELVEDCKFDIIAIELEKMGRNLENQLNQMCLDDCLDNAGNEHDCTGSNTGISAIISAKVLCEADGFYPDVVVMHPTAWGTVFADYKPAYNVESEGTLRTGVMPSIAGCKPYVCGVADASGTYVWGYGTDSYIGMLVMDAKNAGMIGMRKPINVKMHEQPLKMIQSPVVSARWDFVYLHANAISRVEY
jgi:hypothetical protein